MMDFAEKLQSYRKQRGMSQESLAEVIGVSRQAVSKWESGQSYPEMDKMIALSNLFQVSIDNLVKDESEHQSAPAYKAAPDYRGVSGHRDFSDSGDASDRSFISDHSYLYHYEYKSKTTLFGVPLIHINCGRGKRYVAKGIIAVGNIAVGAISVGLIALGGISIGAMAGGLISLAAMSFGLLLAIGGMAMGTIAIGGLALGIFAVGGLAIGMFSIGGGAIASRIAIGGHSNGHIAVGDAAKGAFTIVSQYGDFSDIKADQVRQLIDQEYPNLWKPIVEGIVSIFK